MAAFEMSRDGAPLSESESGSGSGWWSSSSETAFSSMRGSLRIPESSSFMATDDVMDKQTKEDSNAGEKSLPHGTVQK